MKRITKKLLTACLALVLTVAALPLTQAQAATAIPKFKQTYASIYQNGSTKGKYTYTLINVKKGQTVKWTISGAGSSYVKWKKATTKVTGKTASNTFTVKTKGATVAKNKKVTIKAEVFSGSTSLYTISTTAKIKIKPTKVTITAPAEADNVLYVGKSYTFGSKLKPVNATCTKVWTVTGSDNKDYSSYMSKAGVFKPQQAGTYTITLSAKIGSSVIKTATMQVKVGDVIESVKQSDANKIEVNYSGDVAKTLTKDNFSVKSAAGAASVIKSVAFSSDGKTATLTLLTNLRDATSYTVSDGTSQKSFTASVGVPVKLSILTKKVTVNKETEIEYALYDSKDVNVAAAYPGTIKYEAEVTNGYITDAQKLYMTTVGKSATVKATYTSKTQSGLVLSAVGVISCEAAETASDTNFTLTTSETAPNYTASSYKDNRRAAIGKTYYAHFRALDSDKAVINYTSVTYESSDPDALIITKNGKITPIKNGTVKILVTAVYAGTEYAYSYDVTVSEAPKLGSLTLSTSSVTMSNVYSSEYRKYIDVTALDQYSEAFALTSEVASISNTTSNLVNTGVASYDAENNRIVLNASGATVGTYNYTLTLTIGTQKASIPFTVYIVSPDQINANAPTTYAIELDSKTSDLSLSSDVSGSRYVKARLAQYRGGVFTNYVQFTEATVTKDGYYYSTDLTAAGTSAKQTISSSTVLDLKTLDISSDTCSKAGTGTYTVTMQYYSSVAKGYQTVSAGFVLTDTQDAPTLSIERITASKSCSTALELAQNCLSVDNGTISECVVTGETQPGSKVSVKSGDQINIKSITVTGTYTISGGKKITMTYIVTVGKTLTNI